jgi:hypothetical protein
VTAPGPDAEYEALVNPDFSRGKSAGGVVDPDRLVAPPTTALDPTSNGQKPRLRLGQVKTPGGEQDVRRNLVREIAADPIKTAWLREHGAKLLREAAHELSTSLARPVAVLERRAQAHERGETPLW